MSRYLEVAKDIYDWLAGLQVTPAEFSSNVTDGQHRFRLFHPIEGECRINTTANGDHIFRAKGLAIRSDADHSLSLYDAGGIFDPIDGRVQGEHYSTTHFALLGAILFSETKDKAYLTPVKQAIDFHLRTSPTEYQPMSEWMYHWDFQNYAFALTYRLLRDHLTTKEQDFWIRGLKKWRTNYRNKLTNWAAMRAWAYAERAELLGKPIDLLASMWNLRYVAKAASNDGCFDDNVRRSRPIQYHIFTVAIIHRIWQLKKNARLKKWFDDGIEYFLPFIDPDGAFNYIGRGHEQIFGYAAAIYALEAGYKENQDERLSAGAAIMFDYLIQFKKSRYFPLVLNEQPDEQRPGWYDYHHLTVYNAFLGAWLGLTHLLGNSAPKARTGRKTFSWFSEPTQTAIVSTPNYYAAFYGGLEEYLCEASITPHHLWWQGLGFIFSCPGGPTLERFGKHTPPHQEKNLFAPIAKNSTDWYLPAAGHAGQFELRDDHMHMSFDYGPFKVYRQVIFKKHDIEFEDRFEFARDQEFEDFRFFNLPVAIDKFNVRISKSGEIVLKSSGKSLRIILDNPSTRVEQLEITTTAKGRVQAFAVRRLKFTAKKDSTTSFKFKISSAAPA